MKRPIHHPLHCRICRGLRQTDGTICLGCGAPVTPVVQPPQQPQPRTYCSNARCRSPGPHTPIGRNQFRCGRCDAVFEPEDFSHLDRSPRPALTDAEMNRSRRGGGRR